MRKAQGLYIISVASQILNMHPQTLRKYERAGFIEPPRLGTLRLYSDQDIARLRLIKFLVDRLGLNLSGVELALGLATRLLNIRATLATEAPRSANVIKSLKELDRVLLSLGLNVSDLAALEPEEPEGQQHSGSQPAETPRGFEPRL
jgi:MerR family transcriptional regulator/heat shock protein HspR